MKTPLTSSTRVVLPRGVTGLEPTNADAGTLSFDPATDKIRVKLSTGWSDVNTSSGGTITGVTAGTGLSGGGTSGTVTLATVFGTSAGTSIQGNDPSVTNARDPIIHTQTLKSSPVGADEIVITDSAASFALKRATLTSISGLFSSGVSSFNSRTGAVVPTSGDYNATQVGLGNVTNDAQLKRAAGDFATFTSKATPVSGDIFLIEDSAASNAKKQTTLGGIATAIGAASSFNPITDIAPEFYFRALNASNTLSSGRYTTLAALGTDTTTFGTIGTQAPLQGTDSDGNVYVQFDSTGGVATAMQQSGAASTFTFMHDGTTSWTLVLVHDSPGGMSSGGDEFILDNCGGSSTAIGFSLRNEDDSGGFHGPLFSAGAASSGNFTHMLNGRQDANSGFTRRKEITIVRYFRGQHKTAISGVTPLYADIMMLRQGVLTCWSNQNATYSASAPSFKLSIGQNANTSASKWNGRLYELMIVKRALSDRMIANMCGYAATTYKVVA